MVSGEEDVEMNRRLLIPAFLSAVMLLSGCSADVNLIGNGNSKGAADLNENDMEAAAVEDPGLAADDYEGWNKLLSENDISEEFRESLTDFAFESSSAVLSKEDENAVFSPLSLYYALSMLGTGASGETESEIMEVLGIDDKAEIADQCAKLYRRYAYTEERERLLAKEYGMEEPDSSLSLADSLWVSGDISLKPEYQDICANEFYASSYQVDFKDQETGERIGKWISDHTGGVLEPEIELPSDTVLALINTLYYYGGWQDRFDEGLTKEDVFKLEDGSEIEVPFMNRTDTMAGFIKGDGYTLSGISTNNNCEMLFLLPDEDTDILELTADGERLKEIFADTEGKWNTGEVVWKIPKFSFGSSFDLVEALKAMGMESMFDSMLAEFADMSEDALYVDQAIQEAHIAIDEDGVEGAAYTLIAMAEGSAWMMEEPERVEMILDRPFLFAVHDYRNDVWLFIGACMDPSGT